MFKTQFSSLLKMLINNTQNYDYASFIKNDVLITKREVRQAIHKIILNKISKFNEVTNQTLRHLVSVASTQMQSLFAKCIKKEIQSTHFKRVITIVLRKLSKKNYLKLFVFRSIALLDTLKKTLKLIVSKRLRYVIKEAKILSNIQMKTK